MCLHKHTAMPGDRSLAAPSGFKCIRLTDVPCMNDNRCRGYSCTTGGTGDTAVLQEVQEMQLYLDLVLRRRHHVYITSP